jgi:aspartate racemase
MEPGQEARLMSLHIGIVACSAEGAALCYRTICHEGARRLGPYAHPEVSLHSASFARYVANLEAGDWPAIGELMLASADRLAKAGADFLICPDNTIHAALPPILPRSPLPWLHIADVVAEAVTARGMRRVGLLGTRWLVASEVYPPRLAARGVTCVRPDYTRRQRVNTIIMDELVAGEFRPASVAALKQVIAAMKEDGCEGVILGCTELPLVLSDANSPLPVFDSTRLLARATLRRAVESD